MEITPNISQSETKIITHNQAGGDNPPEPKVEEEKKEYQQYKCTRQSQRLITKEGIPITFSGYEFITKTKAIIKYLNSEIEKNGLPGITKGERLSSSERDPMGTLRLKHFAEFQEMKEEERVALARGIIQNMGNTTPLEGRLNPVTSGQVASSS